MSFMTTPNAPIPPNVPADLAKLLPEVYDQLRALARARMAQENPGNTLQATALVHEVFVRLDHQGDGKFANKAHFFAIAAEAMRRILIEHARAKGRIKRGGSATRIPLNLLDLATEQDPDQILSLDDAMQRLEQESPDVAAIVRLRFYAGLSVEETAETLGISARTVNREWTYARAWLYRALGQEP
jgi:RNA polymerase sigma factor (TIGR02999 family)